MDGNTKAGKLPTDIIIASFRGDLTDSQKTALGEWLSAEGNQEKYDALKRVWDSTVSNAGEFESQSKRPPFLRHSRVQIPPLPLTIFRSC